jgi:hypothetical protein
MPLPAMQALKLESAKQGLYAITGNMEFRSIDATVEGAGDEWDAPSPDGARTMQSAGSSKEAGEAGMRMLRQECNSKEAHTASEDAKCDPAAALLSSMLFQKLSVRALYSLPEKLILEQPIEDTCHGTTQVL